MSTLGKACRHALEPRAPAPAARTGRSRRGAPASQARVAGRRALRAREPAVDVRAAQSTTQARAAYRAAARRARCRRRARSCARSAGRAATSGVELVPRDVWGIRGVELASSAVGRAQPRRARRRRRARTTQPRATPPSSFERLVERLLAAAPEELFLRRLGHALSHVDPPREHARAARGRRPRARRRAMRTTLEEREREEHLRLKRFGRRR